MVRSAHLVGLDQPGPVDQTGQTDPASLSSLSRARLELDVARAVAGKHRPTPAVPAAAVVRTRRAVRRSPTWTISIILSSPPRGASPPLRNPRSSTCELLHAAPGLRCARGSGGPPVTTERQSPSPP